MINLFCNSVNKNYSDGNNLPLRCKKLYNFENIQYELSNLEKKSFRNKKQPEVTVYVPHTVNPREFYFKPKQILVFKLTKG